MKTNPFVSVILPNYNHGRFLTERIESILGQTYQNFELIILDDSSQDNSREIIELYRTNDRVSHIVYNTENSGSTFHQWKKGIELSKGELIWIAESDDFADFRLLETLCREFQIHPDIGIAFCQSQVIDQNSEIISTLYNYGNAVLQKRSENEFKIKGTEEIGTILLYKNSIPNASAALFKKTALEEALSRDVLSFKYCGDWYLYTRILVRSSLKYVPAALNNFRTHTGNMRNKKGEFAYERIQIIQFISSQHLAPPTAVKTAFFDAIGFFINSLNRKTLTFNQLFLILKFSFRISPVMPLHLAIYLAGRLGSRLKKLVTIRK